MARSKILLAGESWVTTATHIKGFDQFPTVTFHRGADALADALADSDFALTYMPAHEAQTHFPSTLAGLREYDAVILSDIGSNTLLLHPDTWIDSKPTPNRLKLMRDYVGEGRGLMMVRRLLQLPGYQCGRPRPYVPRARPCGRARLYLNRAWPLRQARPGPWCGAPGADSASGSRPETRENTGRDRWRQGKEGARDPTGGRGTICRAQDPFFHARARPHLPRARPCGRARQSALPSPASSGTAAACPTESHLSHLIPLNPT